MTRSLYDRIWRREAGETSRWANIRGLYGSKEWVDNLDIVNELGGHTGCVNALSWSRSGKLLASGSDDYHLNIYSYQPDSSTAPFSLNTSVYTGHTGNIFSVAFMPHCNDRTLVTAAGDSQVRVFDIEYTNRTVAPLPSTQYRNLPLNDFFSNARYLGVGNTNARIYRSHADRAKRIVTESSPHLFLTCSEDGEVRQWDLRLPSSAYPKPRGGLLFMAHSHGGHDDSNVPPPLISYKRHRVDLNTISCSPSQPHYIALGGAHLHCFLHDRRMLGRDLSVEKGDPGASPGIGDEERMNQATRCVRKFAPNGKQRTKSPYKGHITACKISNANPNEMIVSWSGDHIYSFDLIRSPDATEIQQARQSFTLGKSLSRRRRGSKNRKRKRHNGNSLSSNSSGGRRRSRRSDATQENGELAFRVRYGNGEVENISLPSLLQEHATSDATSAEILEQARYSVLSEAQKHSLRIAKGLVKLRKALFSLEASVREEAELSNPFSIMAFKESFSSVLMQAATLLPQMEEAMRTWGYPMNPTPEVVRVQQALRRNRESSYRFIQAAGTLARALGGEAQSPGLDERELEMFQQIKPTPGEDGVLSRREQFGYDFLKAILLFVQGGRGSVFSGFKHESTNRRHWNRFPIPENADERAIETVLIPYLQELADSTLVVNVDTSRFEHDITRVLFPSQHAAVDAFSYALNMQEPIKNPSETPADIDNHNGNSNSATTRATDPSTSLQFWLLEVGRGILMEAGTGVNFEFVNRAFGGLNATVEDEASESEIEIERSQDDTEANIEEEPIQDISLTITRDPSRDLSRLRDDVQDGTETPTTSSVMESDEDENGDAMEESDDFAAALGLNFDDSSDENEDDEDDDDDDDDENGFDGDSSDTDPAERMFRNYGFQRSQREEEVEADVPCSPHTRVYTGHCNVKTVKDANYFGLNDEYVVSGSDLGHIFIWERDTCKLVNILKGDDEVVNVVQGHPYEPTMAVSGIDDTIKIFSPDQRAQEDARRGINILDPSNPANTLGPGYGGLKSCKCMHDSYRIMSENDVQRQGGMSDAFITRHMLAQFAATVREQQGGLASGENARIVLDENCADSGIEIISMPTPAQNLQDRADVTARLYADPHNPHLHLERGLVHQRLGFADLASADAYRALSLLDSVLDPEGCEFHARRKLHSDVATEQDEEDDEDEDEDEAFESITETEFNEIIGPVYALLVKSLVRCGCLRDAYEFAVRGLAVLQNLEVAIESVSSAKRVLLAQIEVIKRRYYGRNPSGMGIDIQKLNAQGSARRILYPWNEHEPDRKAPDTLLLLNERLKDVAPKCEVRAVALPALHSTTATTTTTTTADQETPPKDNDKEQEDGEVSIQLGLFAKEDLFPGETILHETSLLTATNRLHDDLCDACNGPLPNLGSSTSPIACAGCDDTIFCSASCHDRAQEIYHGAVCGLMEGLESIGKDIPDAKDKADYLYLLLLGRAIAMAATQEMHPLDLPEVKYIWGDFHDFQPSSLAHSGSSSGSEFDSTTTSNLAVNSPPPPPPQQQQRLQNEATLPFSFHLNILQPMRILEEMELDPYTTLPLYDTWVLNTLYAKFRGTASGRLSTWDGGPELCAVHPLWCLANHSCDPNVKWEWGGEITFRVRGAEERAVWTKSKSKSRTETATATATATEKSQGIKNWNGIRKDEEILNHYCDIGLDVKERREWARGALGGGCLCERCIWEAGGDC
ncbi:hypothetical protein AOCH_007398 [Aspergillus ochraceoroseus]|uniref:MYND-type domain-containing protein n=1 Tax=Aspergillus ochraceoroseus TaxID=138278 RepID=A0A0F8WZY4_9EURO|nr:hypothetical protein AOCH_007398 [Aspergillus ochraceoroseus]